MAENIILGIIQGIAEWLPVSSEGMIMLTRLLVFKDQSGFDILVQDILFLHLGSALAAVVYFRKEILALAATSFQYKKHPPADRKTLIFLVISTGISGLLGLGLIWAVTALSTGLFTSLYRPLLLLIGTSLLLTAWLQHRADSHGQKLPEDLKLCDAVWLGLAQGLAVIPGLSRSGMTVSALLLRKFAGPTALRLSFLMSIPIILLGNVALVGLAGWKVTPGSLAGLVFAFVCGLLTIHALLKLARQVNFAVFIAVMAALVILSAFLPVS
ncbi:MAG: undecaprenyl-diphosphate phosphatase [Candidatus Omnitrophota bacterium]